MADYSAFSPQGKTVLVAAATSAPAGVQVPTFSAAAIPQATLVFYNSGSVDAFMGYAQDATTAQTNSVVPTGTSQQVVCVPAKMMVTYKMPPNSFISGTVASGGPANVYITPGEGV